jgi:glycine hydroxymethyltransferase
MMASLLEAEALRQRTTLQLIASENFASRAVMDAAGTVLTNKYSEGYPGKRYYGGNGIIDQVEQLAIDRLKELFRAEHANVQPHSGANANAAVYFALLDPGDVVVAMRLDQGGHLTHGSPVNFSGKLYRFSSYGVTPRGAGGERLDLDSLFRVARQERPKLIVVGATAYPRQIEIEPIREIADEVGALVLFDAAHVAGLIAGGQYPNPLWCSDGRRGADVVTFTTHKTLRGPRGGAIVCHADLASKVDKALFPGFQGGPIESAIAAKAVAFNEALQPSFADYQSSVIANAQRLSSALETQGFRLVSGGTDTHLLLVDLEGFDPDLSGKEAQESLDVAGITCNRNQVPEDPRSPFVTSGLRFGTPAVTTAGMGLSEMDQIGALIARALLKRSDRDEVERIRREVAELTASFPPPADR